jgi:autotransporter-associated beta strand protein
MKNKKQSMFQIHSSKRLQKGALATASLALLVASTAWAADLTWDNGDSTGNWNTTDWNWTGSQWSNSNPDSASFDNRNETVTLTEAITANAVAFRAGGTGSGAHLLTLTGGSLSAASVTVNGRSLGGEVGGVAESNNQRLKLTGTSVTVSGDVSVGRGSLEVTAATLSVGGQIRSSSDWTNLVLGSGAVVTATGGVDYTASGVIASNLDFNGGTLTTPFIYGNNYSTSVNFNGTTVVASIDTSDFLRIQGGHTIPAWLRSGGLIFDSNGKTVTLANPLINYSAETGILTKQGTGTLILTGASNYSGATAVNQGTLQIGNGAVGATIVGTSGVTVASGATLAFNHSDNQIFSKGIAGTGGLLKDGSGILTLGGTNSYTGTTTIQSGTLKLSKTVLTDDFTATGTPFSPDLNYNIAGRQTGSMAPQTWTKFNTSWGAQVGNPSTDVGQPGGASNSNYLLLSATGKASLTTLALNSTTAPGPIAISCDMFNGTNPGDWTSFTLTPATGEGWWYGDTIGFPVPGAIDAFGWRKNGDGTSGVLNVPYVDNYVFSTLSGNNFSFLLTDTAGTGSAFAGNGTKITMMNGATTLGSFNMAGAGLTTSYITFAANSAQTSGIDNLAISSPGTNVLNAATNVVLSSGSAALTLDQIDQTVASLSGPAGSTVNLDYRSTLRVTGTASTTFAGVITGASGSLVKAGSGTLALTGTNSYSGNTTVTAGTLSLGNGTANSALADGSTITLAAGAVLNLNFSSGNSDTVKELYLGTPAVLVPAGTYNSSTPTYGGYFTGAGSLVVTTGSAVSAYDTWMNLYPTLAGADKLPTADPDHDGLTNQQEFAFGLIPNSGASVNPILVPLNKATGTFSYQRRASSGLTYKILTSTDLLTWPEDSGANQSAGAVDGNGNQTVTVTLSGTTPLTAPKLFIRVSAE